MGEHGCNLRAEARAAARRLTRAQILSEEPVIHSLARRRISHLEKGAVVVAVQVDMRAQLVRAHKWDACEEVEAGDGGQPPKIAAGVRRDEHERLDPVREARGELHGNHTTERKADNVRPPPAQVVHEVNRILGHRIRCVRPIRHLCGAAASR
eukprot:scaffold290057_cov33-Tisochrysis_lutea.AAC.3